MTLCILCNWTPHDVSIHGELCCNGHPIEIVGVYTAGQRSPVCRACQRAASRRYRDSHLEQERARVRANDMRRRANAKGREAGIVGGVLPLGRQDQTSVVHA